MYLLNHDVLEQIHFLQIERHLVKITLQKVYLYISNVKLNKRTSTIKPSTSAKI